MGALRSRRGRALLELLGPVGLLVLVGIAGSALSLARQQDVLLALVQATAVIGIWIFVGTSGVLSFGHIAFVALGAFTAGVLTIPAATKPFVMPELFGVLRDAEVGNLTSLFLAATAGALLAFVTGSALMRLGGLAAGIATFAVLEIVHNVLRNWDKIGPGPTTLSLVPTTTTMTQATAGAVLAAVVAWGYARTRSARRLRAAREDEPAALAIGVRVYRERLTAFVLSGAVAGLAGGLLVHQLGSITSEQVYLELTFLTLAMLVVGGTGSLWGATVGALLVSGLDSVLSRAEGGALPDGASLVVLGLLMLLVLVLRPRGLTGGREFGLPGRLGGAAAVGPPGADPLSGPAAASGPPGAPVGVPRP